MKTRNHILPLAAAMGVLATSAQAATNIEGVADFTLSSSSTAGATHDNLPAAFQAQLAPGIITSTASSNHGAAFPESALTDGSLATGGVNAWASGVASSVTLTLDFASADVAGVILNWGWANRTIGDYQVLVDGNSLGSIRVDEGGGTSSAESNEPNTYIIFDSVQSGATKIEVITSNGGPAGLGGYWGLDEIEVYTGTAGPDNTPPSISSLSPADDTADVAVDTAFVATFDEPIAVLSGGQIYLTDLDTPAVTTIAATDASQVSVSGADLIIDPTSDLANSTTYAITFGANTISDLATTANIWSDTTFDTGSWNVTTIAPDETPPTIVPPTDPADDSTGVAIGTAFVATFSEPIALTATGTITVTDGSETRVVNLDGSADDGDASVLGDVLTITLDADLTNNLSSYDVLISNDAIVDTAPAMNPFAGTVAGDWNFTTAANGTAMTFGNTPVDGSPDGAGSAGFVMISDSVGGGDAGSVTEFSFYSKISGTTITPLIFDNTFKVIGVGTTRTTTTDAGVETFAFGLVAGSADIGPDKFFGWQPSGTNVSPVAFNGGGGTSYFLSPVDIGLGGTASIAGTLGRTYSMQFTVISGPDLTAPSLVSVSPPDNTADVAIDTAFMATFDEPIAVLSGGQIYLTDLDTPSVTTIAATDASQVSVSGADLIIDPTSDLANSTTYAITFGANTISDLATSANIWSDTTFDTSSWNVTTIAPDETAPSVSTFAPTNGESGVSPSTNLVVTFDEDVQAGSGNILIREFSGGAIVSTIAVTSANVTFNGAEVTIDPPADLGSSTQYYVEIEATAIDDLAGNSFAGITGSGTWNFTTGTAGTWSSSPWADDADLTAYLSGSATYTHAIDFEGGTEGTQSSATIAGVSFTQYEFTNWNNVARNGTDLGTGKAWSYTQTNQAWQGNAASGPSGTESDKLSTGFLGALAGQTETLTLEGLDANTDYVFTLYNAKWDTNTRTASLDGLDDGVGNARVTDPDNTFVSYAYNTGASTSFSMNITGTGVNEYNIYAFTNQLALTGGGGGSAFDTWADSNGLTEGVNDGQGQDADSGDLNNLGEFGLGGDPLNQNDDGSLLHAFSDDLVGGDGIEEGILTILVRSGTSFTSAGDPAVSDAAVDGITYSVAADTTPDVDGGGLTVTPTAAVTTGLPAAPAGYEYASFYISGAEGYFQVTVAPE